VRDVVFVMLPDLVLLDLAGPTDAFRFAAAAVPGSYRLRFVGEKASVAAAGGLTFSCLQPLPAHLAPGSLLVLIGSQGSNDRDRPRLLEWLRATAASAVLVCVCKGSLLAARAGLLAGRECTTHHEYIEELRRTEPRARVLENRIFVQDGPVYTSAGVTAGLDLALYIIGQDLGPAVAAGIARDLVVYLRRTGTDPALSPWLMHRNHLHPAVHRVQDAVARNPTARWRASELARVACTSTRNLTRLFGEHAGCTPLDYVQRIRFGLARQLVTQSRLDLERVASRSGFSSAQQLRRVWMRWETRPPSAIRGAAARASCGAAKGASTGA
jgi:transcriptional regulator GlxA family with amidase domain